MLKLLAAAIMFVALATMSAVADPHPAGFEPHKFNGSHPPVTEDGVTTFRIENEQCSSVDFGDGRGESDCLNGTVRSVFGYSPQAELGQTREYRFDVRVDPSLAYEGYFNDDSIGFEPRGWDSLLWLASWEGTFLHNFIYILKASKRTGITFAGEVCQTPEDLGEWVSFSMKVKWGNDDKAWIVVTCDDRYVYVAEGAPSNVAPDCYIQNQCVAGEVRNPKRLLFIPGIKLSGWGYEWEQMGKASQFIPIQPDGIVVQMRNLAVTSDPVLYGPEDKARVVALQEALNGLGCDVGAADGVPGKRTREAALTCRAFPAGEMPDALNVATVQAFVDLYTGEGVGDLTAGEVAADALDIRLFQQGSETSGPEKYVAADFEGHVTGEPSGVSDLRFLLNGEFDYAASRFEWFSLLMLDDLKGNKTVGECERVRIEDWDDGTSHAVIEFDPMGKYYIAADMTCVAANLPAEISRQATFIIDHFAELGTSLVADGGIEGVTNDGLQLFLRRAATGEVVVKAGLR